MVARRPITLRPLLKVERPVASIPPAVTLTPVLAVIIPSESILVTSSYVKVPAIDTVSAVTS